MTSRDGVQSRSVQVTGPGPALEVTGDEFVLNLASVADSFFQWGSAPRSRDRQLREFWPTEPILASALYSVVIRNAAFSWTLEGPERTVAAVQDMLQGADFGKGWRNLMTKVGIDLFSQDNGAFIEIIRASNSANAPTVGIAHLDAFRCTRTADPDFPVIYTDRKGIIHRLAWYQVVALSEFPSPVETMFGVQLCAVSRVLRAAQYLRDIGIYQREKVGGDNPNAIYLAGGVSSKAISDAMEQHKARQAERGMVRYIIPLIVGSLDPTAAVNVEQIDLKSLPDGFNIKEVMETYINQLALGLGVDYQDLAPLPGRGLGTSAQSMVLHQKSRGRGPAMFMSMMEQAFNFQGILPNNVLFRYDEQDVEADLEQAELEDKVSETLDRYVKNGTLTPGAARQVMLDKGMLSQEVFDVLQEGEDVTPDVVAHDDEPVDSDTPSEHIGGVQTAARHEDDDEDKKKPPKRNRRRLGGNYKAEHEDDNLPVAFAETERIALEFAMENDMVRVFNRAFTKARRIMGLPRPKGLSLSMGTKAEPEDIFAAEAFWETFQADAVNTMMPLARQGALEAATVNLDLGIAVDMDLVNAEVLDFSSRYATAWWDELEVATQNSLRKAISTWQESGLGRRGLPDLVKAIEPTFGRARAERIAVNEVTQIFDEGNRLAHNAGGIEEEEWQTVEDTAVEEICKKLNGNRFPTNSGPRPVKDTHIGCRCARIAVGTDGQVIGG